MRNYYNLQLVKKPTGTNKDVRGLCDIAPGLTITLTC